MSDRPTPMTFDPYPWNQNGPGRSHRPEVMYPCDDGEWVKLDDYRDLESKRKEWMDRTIDALAQAGNLKEQRDAYAETLRIIATANARTHHRASFTDLISERHPELSENSPALPPTVGSGEGSNESKP